MFWVPPNIRPRHHLFVLLSPLCLRYDLLHLFIPSSSVDLPPPTQLFLLLLLYLPSSSPHPDLFFHAPLSRSPSTYSASTPTSDSISSSFYFSFSFFMFLLMVLLFLLFHSLHLSSVVSFFPITPSFLYLLSPSSPLLLHLSLILLLPFFCILLPTSFSTISFLLLLATLSFSSCSPLNLFILSSSPSTSSSEPGVPFSSECHPCPDVTCGGVDSSSGHRAVSGHMLMFSYSRKLTAGSRKKRLKSELRPLALSGEEAKRPLLSLFAVSQSCKVLPTTAVTPAFTSTPPPLPPFFSQYLALTETPVSSPC